MSDNAPPFTASLNEQRTEATILIDDMQIVLTAEELENVIAYLGLLRSQLTPPVSETPMVNHTLPIDLPSIQREGEATEKGATLYIRAPYFGWFQVYLSSDWCVGLISYLRGGEPTAPEFNATKH